MTHPIRRRALWVAVISIVGNIVSTIWGEPLGAELQATLNQVLDLALLAGLVLASEKVVTPVARPRDDDGNELVPVVKNPI